MQQVVCVRPQRPPANLIGYSGSGMRSLPLSLIQQPHTQHVKSPIQWDSVSNTLCKQIIGYLDGAASTQLSFCNSWNGYFIWNVFKPVLSKWQEIWMLSGSWMGIGFYANCWKVFLWLWTVDDYLWTTAFHIARWTLGDGGESSRRKDIDLLRGHSRVQGAVRRTNEEGSPSGIIEFLIPYGEIK